MQNRGHTPEILSCASLVNLCIRCAGGAFDFKFGGFLGRFSGLWVTGLRTFSFGDSLQGPSHLRKNTA